MFEAVRTAPRLLMEVDLKPIQGDRFQPTGFADLGAAVYQRPDGKRMLLVESAQSVANRLEKTCLDGDGPGIAKELQGLPFVHVRLTGQTETATSSLMEAHRLNSPFIISDKVFQAEFTKRSGYAEHQPLDWKKIAAAILYFDPNSLLHGVFMANLGDGRVKVPRAITGFIEAEDIREVASGGVKNNPIDPTGTVRAAGYDKDVYGNVPYHRMEYTAARIRGYFNLDTSQLVGFGLPHVATDLLIALGLYKVRRFLTAGLRLRTACDLTVVGELNATAPAGFAVPDEAALLKAVQDRIKVCAAEGLFNSPPVKELVTSTVKKEKKDKGDSSESGES